MPREAFISCDWVNATVWLLSPTQPFTHSHKPSSLFQSYPTASHCLPSHAPNTTHSTPAHAPHSPLSQLGLSPVLMKKLLIEGPSLYLLTEPWLVNARGANHFPRTKLSPQVPPPSPQ
ncbi:unnamed protein product [Sphenostylis stenocarpa]|uniref:Uncharacterized protein n=1 Tax=Sphenostylis stenocarpa TaxID=92480 RepID=A0AA86TP25_9FABA|nr:unnamed protein product [Sphenostylis stenocarpa]